MNNKQAKGTVAAIWLLGSGALLSASAAATLTGKVVDEVTRAGIGEVEVTAVDSKGKRQTDLSAPDGTYRLDGLAAGEVTLEYRHGKYVFNPTRRTQGTAEPEAKVPEVELFRQRPDANYITAAAQALAAANPEKARERMKRYGELPILLSATAAIAQQAARANVVLATAPEFSVHKDIDVVRVAAFERQVEALASGGTQVATLPRGLVAPLVAEKAIKAQKNATPALPPGKFDGVLESYRKAQ